MKNWIKTNLSKITLALALTGAVSGITSLIIGSIAHDKTKCLCYFLNNDHTAVWGNTTIWQENVGGINKIRLYFNTKPEKKDDIVWNGIYPQGYFWN